MSDLRLRIYTLCSGSEGNAVFVGVGDTCFLIDAGRSCKQLCGALAVIGETAQRLCALFVTHEHIDHIRGIPVLCKRGTFPVYALLPTARAGGLASLAERLCPLTVGQSVTVQGEGADAPCVTVTPFSVPHDSAACVGYRIDTPWASVGLATDVGYPTQGMMERLCGCDYLILESNHDPQMLKTGPYPYALKQRILSRGGHLSNADCARCCVALAQSGAKRILLAHLSLENNTPALAYDTCTAALGEAQCDACRVAVAKRSEPSCLIDVAVET